MRGKSRATGESCASPTEHDRVPALANMACAVLKRPPRGMGACGGAEAEGRGACGRVRLRSPGPLPRRDYLISLAFAYPRKDFAENPTPGTKRGGGGGKGPSRSSRTRFQQPVSSASLPKWWRHSATSTTARTKQESRDNARSAWKSASGNIPRHRRITASRYAASLQAGSAAIASRHWRSASHNEPLSASIEARRTNSIDAGDSSVAGCCPFPAAAPEPAMDGREAGDRCGKFVPAGSALFFL